MGKEDFCLDPLITMEQITQLTLPLFAAAKIWIGFEFLGKKIVSWRNEEKNESEMRRKKSVNGKR